MTAKLPFEAVVAQHGATVLRVCRAILGRSDADDAWSETFLSALRAYPRLRAGSNLRAWGLTVAHRKALDVHRARSRAPVAVGVAGEDRSSPAPADPDDELWEAVRALPDGQRAALTLRFAGDLEPREVAAALRISPEAARRRIADGLARLRLEYDA